MKKIEIFEWPEGDWVVVFADEKWEHTGHNIPFWVWSKLIMDYGANGLELALYDVDDSDGSLCNETVAVLRQNSKLTN